MSTFDFCFSVQAKIPKSFSLYTHRDHVVEGDSEQLFANSNSVDKSAPHTFVVEFANDVDPAKVYIQCYKTGKYWGYKPAEAGGFMQRYLGYLLFDWGIFFNCFGLI